jgi:hypothetical protein
MAYNIVPLLLIILAFSFLNRYKPEFGWKFNIISATDNPKFYDVSPTVVTQLSEEPYADVSYTGEVKACGVFQNITYVHNALLDKKTSIERNVSITYFLLLITAIAVILDFSILTLSFLTGKVTFFSTIAFSFLLCVLIVFVLTLVSANIKREFLFLERFLPFVPGGLWVNGQ